MGNLAKYKWWILLAIIIIILGIWYYDYLQAPEKLRDKAVNAPAANDADQTAYSTIMGLLQKDGGKFSIDPTFSDLLSHANDSVHNNTVTGIYRGAKSGGLVFQIKQLYDPNYASLLSQAQGVADAINKTPANGPKTIQWQGYTYTIPLNAVNMADVATKQYLSPATWTAIQKVFEDYYAKHNS